MSEFNRSLPSNEGASGRREELVVEHLSLVRSVARRMTANLPPSVDVQDLIQSGVIGLMQAAERFDPSRGIEFSTFAEQRIRGEILDALRKGSWPRGLRKMRRSLESGRQTLTEEFGFSPSDSDLAKHLGVKESDIRRYDARIRTTEATSPFSSATIDNADLPDSLRPSVPPAPDRAYEQGELKNRIRSAIRDLPWREQLLVIQYFYHDKTLEQIAGLLYINQSRASQLLSRAIEVLEKSLAHDRPKQPVGKKVTNGNGHATDPGSDLEHMLAELDWRED